MALQQQEKPLLCKEGHLPDFEMECEIPDVFQGVFGMPEKQKRWVCVDCRNTVEYFQRYGVVVRELSKEDGTIVQ